MGKINWKDREAVNQYAREYRKNLTEEKRLIYKEQTRIYQKENPDKMRAANKRWRDEKLIPIFEKDLAEQKEILRYAESIDYEVENNKELKTIAQNIDGASARQILDALKKYGLEVSEKNAVNALFLDKINEDYRGLDKAENQLLNERTKVDMDLEPFRYKNGNAGYKNTSTNAKEAELNRLKNKLNDIDRDIDYLKKNKVELQKIQEAKDTPFKVGEPTNTSKKLKINQNDNYEIKYTKEERNELESGNKILQQIAFNQEIISEPISEDAKFEKIREVAKEKGFLIDNLDQKLGNEDGNGTEALVWMNEKKGSVTKAISYDMEGGIGNLIDKIIAHNSLFHETKIEVKGLGTLSDGTNVFIVEQPFILFNQKSNLSKNEVIEFMKMRGFSIKGDGEYPVFTNGRYDISDLHEGNIGKTQKGNIAVIDFFADINREKTTEIL